MIKIVNWVQGLRADLPDMLSGLVRTNYERLASRTIDNEDNPVVAGPFGGHVIKGFGVDMFTGGIGAVSFASGTFLDMNGLPIPLAAFSLDLTALGGGLEAAIWARWDLVGTDNANRKRLVAGVKTTIAHNTRQDVTVVTDATALYTVPPDVLHDWTLIGRLLSSGGTLNQYAGPATIVWRPNAAWESDLLGTDFEREVKVSAITAAEDAEGDALYPLVEKLRTVAGTLRGGAAAQWDAAPTRDVETLSTDLGFAEGSVVANAASALANAFDIGVLQLTSRWARAVVSLVAGPTPVVVGTSGFAAPTIIGAGIVQWDFSVPIVAASMIAGIPSVTLTIHHDVLNAAAPRSAIEVTAYYYNGGGDCTGVRITSFNCVGGAVEHVAYSIDVRP